jgi:hypothetical protein
MRTLSLLLILLIAAAAFAQEPLPDATIGTRPGAFSARSLSLGHTFLTDQTGPAALLGNPATLAAQEQRLLFVVSGDVARVEEKRKYPYYDAFNAILGYNNYAVNDHVYSKIDGGIAWRIPVKELESLVISAGTYSTYGFDYTYHEEVRSRSSQGGILDQRLGENRLDLSGDLRSISLGAAARQHDFALGFGVNLLSGDWTYLNGVYYASPDSHNIVNSVKYKPSGTPAELTIGATYVLDPRVTFGARALVPMGKYKFDQTGVFEHDTISLRSTGTTEVTYPKQFAAGVTFRPQNEFRPVLHVEGEFRTYSDIADSYNDVWEFRAGAEQQVVAGVPIRVGFAYTTSPSDKDKATTVFTVGMGFRLSHIAGDIGVEMGRMNSTSPDLFPQSLYGGTNRTDLDRVETSLFRGLVTLKYEL